jgi:hypothetical protein
MFWKSEAQRIYEDQLRGAPPTAIRSVPRPRSAHLSADGTLSWKWYSNAVLHGFGKSVPTRFRRIHTRLSERFADLADAPDEAIRRFAAQWGPLRYPKRTIESFDDVESILEWRRFATLTRALVRCASALSEGTSGLPQDWRSICEWLQIAAEQNPSTEHGLLLVASALNLWYARSSGNALVEIQRNKMILCPRCVFLFWIIGLQLAYAITGAQDTLVCYHCARFYTPKNRPRTGSRNFCPTCRRHGKPVLYAMRDLRARRRLHGGDR